MRKTMTILISLLLIFSLSGCCFALAAAGLGIGFYFVIQKYGKLLYFGDFWASFGSEKVQSEIQTQISTTDPTGGNYDPVTGEYTTTGSLNEVTFAGRFGSYKGIDGDPLTYSIVMQFDPADPTVSPTLTSMTISGKVAVTQTDATIRDLVGLVQFIHFENTSIDTAGAVVDGVVRVDDLQLVLSEYSDLIAQITNLEI